LGGNIKDFQLSAFIVKPTEKMYYIRLLDHNEVVRVLARNVIKVDARKEVIALIVDELHEIRKRMEALELLLHNLRLDI
jgi:hypothetical protein